MALEGTYPIVIDGVLAGKLTVTAQGARTVFDAVCRPQPGVVRISVYGSGAEGPLGVLAPDGEQIGLHKTLSRTELKNFPQEIESVERSGIKPAVAEEEPAAPVEQAAGDAATKPAAEVPEDTGGLFWYSSPDGALVCFDGTRSLIALPVGDERIPEGYEGHRRYVEGKEYIVYITKNGRIVH